MDAGEGRRTGRLASHGGPVTIRPLVAFFAWRRPARVQLVFFLLYLIGAVHLSFFSLSGRDPLEARNWLLSTWLPLLLPIWAVDGELNRRRSLRVFVWPLNDLWRLLTGYIVARGARTAGLAIAFGVLTLNTWLPRDPQSFWTLVACGTLGLFVTAFVMFWNVIAGSKSVYPTIYAAGAVLLWVLSRLADSRNAMETAQFLLIPVWLLDPVSAATHIRDPFHLLQALSASTVWFSASCCVLRRTYR